MTTPSPDREAVTVEDDDQDAAVCACFVSPGLTWWLFLAPGTGWVVTILVEGFGGPDLAWFVPVLVIAAAAPLVWRVLRGRAWALTRTGRAWTKAADTQHWACAREAHEGGCPPHLFPVAHEAVQSARANAVGLVGTPLRKYFGPPVFPSRALAWRTIPPILSRMDLTHRANRPTAAWWAGAAVRSGEPDRWADTLAAVDYDTLTACEPALAWSDGADRLPIELVVCKRPVSRLYPVWHVARKAGFTGTADVVAWMTAGTFRAVGGVAPENLPVVQAWYRSGIEPDLIVRAAGLGWSAQEATSAHQEGTLRTTLEMLEALR